MNVTVAVFQERVGSEYRWTTLGLGEHTQRERGPHPARLQQKISAALREVIAKLPPRDLGAVELVRGTRLQLVRVELSLRHEGRRRKVSMLCPVVIEPRWASDETRFVVAYHPARQGRWFPLHDDEPVGAAAAAFFDDDWAALPDRDVDALRLRGRAVLKSFSFSATPRSLLDELPDRPRGVWDDLRNDRSDPRREERREVLPQVGVDLTWKAIDGALSGGVPRSPTREELRSLVCQPVPQPVLAVGPSGSGRTTALERLTLDLLEHDGYASHRNADRVRRVWQVSGKRIIAGMSYLGDWQQRCLDVCAEARALKAVLWVTDLPHWGRIGRSRDSEMNLAEFFQGPLARRELSMFAECSPEQLRQLEEEAPAFASLFTRVRVPPAGAAETMRLLIHEARRLEAEHQRLTCQPSALREILEVGASLFPMRAQPGKALDLLRQTALDALVEREGACHVNAWQIDRALSQRTGLAQWIIGGTATVDPKGVADELSAQVMGQPEAVEAAVDLVARIRAGITDPKRPYAVYLFTGPTGTGKTELAKALAGYLYGSAERMVRIDMGEYGAPDAAARLVGDRWNPEGSLTRAVQAQPFCVVLLDEIEKAHPQVHNLLLQLFDEARLTDAAGVPASFAHAVVVMTSNLGARAEPVAGFAASEVPTEAEHLRAVREFFPPELFNRIDRVVSFRPLTPEVARAVVTRELGRLTRRRGLLERNVFVAAADDALDLAVREAFRAADGARSLKRWLEHHVGTLLTEHLVKKPDNELQLVRVRGGGGALSLDVETLAEAEPARADYPLEDCLNEPLPTLRARIADARRRLHELAASPALATLSERIGELVARHRDGARAHDDALYTLESLRGEIAALAEHLEHLERAASAEEDWDLRALEIEDRAGAQVDPYSYKLLRVRGYDRRAVGAAPPPARDQVLDALSEVAALRRALATVDDEGQHAVRIELARATAREFQGESAPLGAEGGLFEQLAAAYAKARGTFEGAVTRAADGSVTRCATHESMLDAARDAERVVLEVSGLCVRDFFAAEAGTHVWRSLAGVPEIVRVDVRGCDGPLEAPTAGPVAGPVPRVVRLIRFDAPTTQGTSGPLELEDYATGLTRTVSARLLTDPLPGLWRARLAREENT
jgi:ATP-dependent Clp protease ATP-binding subunit ClpC